MILLRIDTMGNTATSLAVVARARPWLDRAIEQSPELPPPVLRVLAAMIDGDSSMSHLRPALDDAEDLRTRVLAIANSPLYSPASPIEDVSHAAVIIGQRTLMGLTLAYGLRNQFQVGGSVHDHDHNGLLTHSLATATTAWHFANEREMSEQDAGAIYVAGLFHDVGKVLVARFVRVFKQRVAFSETPCLAPGLAGLEHEMLGIDHAEVSALLARRWQLGDRVADLIAQHHQPNGDPLADVLHVADYFTAAISRVGFLEEAELETPPTPRSLESVMRCDDDFVRAGEIALREGAFAAMTVEQLS